MAYPYSRQQGLLPRIPMSDPSQKARDWMGQASGTYGRMQAGQTTKTKRPGPSIGGAMMGGMGGAATGAMVGSVVPGIGTTAGAVGGFFVGLGSYLFS